MQSVWFGIFAAVSQQLRAVAVEQDAAFIENPPLPISPGASKRVLFVISSGDRLIDQPGQRREKRRMRFVVGALALTAEGTADSDALHFEARARLRDVNGRPALSGAGAFIVREVELDPSLKDVAAEGALLMSAYEVEYLQTYPNAA